MSGLVSPVRGPSSGVVVIPIGIAEYSEPTAAALRDKRKKFANLASVTADIARLRALFDSEAYRLAGFQVRPVVSGTSGHITDELTRISQELVEGGNRVAVLIWTGHGEAPSGDLRLATYETFHPMSVGDGLAPSVLVDKLVGSKLPFICLLLDVCQAGAGVEDLAETAAERFAKQPPGQNAFRGMAALFSAYAFEQAAGGLFVEVLERVLREGPSPEAQERFASDGYGGFNVHNRLVTPDEINAVLDVEFELLKKTRPKVQAPFRASVGRPFGLFPNPLFKPDAPSLNVEAARKRWLLRDIEAHFLPKARGLEPGEAGWLFTGRTSVSRDIVDWLQARPQAPADNVYVLTGDGGTGKSAIIGRMVALTDAAFRAAVAAEGWNESGDSAQGTVPPLDAFDAALHLRGLTAAAASTALSELLNVELTAAPGDLASIDSRAPARLPGSDRPITIALDALDESTEPARIAELLVQPLARKGWRVLVGGRRSAAHRGAPKLLDDLGPAHRRSLDQEPSTDADIADYIAGRLLAAPNSPYSRADAEAIGRMVAARAGGRFLYARITASGLLRHPITDVSRVERELADNVGGALKRELAELDRDFRAAFRRKDDGATALLAALAWGRGGGLPLRDGIWPLVASALAPGPSAAAYSEEHARWALREAGRYIVESGDGTQSVYRLFHESLAEQFRPSIDTGGRAAERRIAEALRRDVAAGGGWAVANPYVVRYLPLHLENEPAELELLFTDAAFLRRAIEMLGVDALVDALLAAQRASNSAGIAAVAKTLRRARVALNRDPSQVVAQLHARLSREQDVALRRLIDGLEAVAPSIWLRATSGTLGWRADLEGMQTFPAKVRALDIGQLDGQPVIAVGAGAKVHLWDPRRGEADTRVIDAPHRVTGVALGTLDGREVIALAFLYDRQVEVRNLRTDTILRKWEDSLMGRGAIGVLGAQDVLVMHGYSEPSVRALSPEGSLGEERRLPAGAALVGRCLESLVLVRRTGTVFQQFDAETQAAIGAAVEVSEPVEMAALGEWRGQPVLCVLTADQVAIVADLASGQRLGEERRFEFRVRTLVVGDIEGQLVIAAGNDSDYDNEGYVALRQPLVAADPVQPGRREMAEKRIVGVGRSRQSGRLVVFVDDGTAIDPLTAEVTEPTDDFHLLCGVRLEGRPPGASHPEPVSERGETWGLLQGRPVLVRGHYGGRIEYLDAITGAPVRQRGSRRAAAGATRRRQPSTPSVLKKKQALGHSLVEGIALSEWGGRAVLAVARANRAHVLDAITGELLASPDTGQSEIVAVAVGEAQGRSLLVTGSLGGSVNLWEQGSKWLASLTLDTSVERLWLAGDTIIARTKDLLFHYLEVATRAKEAAGGGGGRFRGFADLGKPGRHMEHEPPDERGDPDLV